MHAQGVRTPADYASAPWCSQNAGLVLLSMVLPFHLLKVQHGMT